MIVPYLDPEGKLGLLNAVGYPCDGCGLLKASNGNKGQGA
jgi:hypothetical protein